jgi:hypothetical protein
MWHAWRRREIPQGKNHLEDLDVDGRLIFKQMFNEVEWKGVNWIDLAEDRGKWRAVVNTVMNLRVS